MTRIKPITEANADPKQKEILSKVKKSLGGVPNIIGTLAQSPAAATAYLGFEQALSLGTLSRPVRERIALTVGQANSCHYCLAAHTALGTKAGLSEGEVLNARHGDSEDARTAAALRFAGQIVERRGEISDADLEDLRAHGYSDGETIEIVANVVLNILTNYANHIAGTEIDFPVAPELAAA